MPASCHDVYPRANGTHLIRPAEEVWKVEVDCQFADDDEGLFIYLVICLKNFQVVSKRLNNKSVVITGFVFFTAATALWLGGTK